MTTVDPGEFRRTMGLFATGVTVITTRAGDIIHGMTANSVTSVSLNPLLILVCVDNRARMAQVIPETGRFAINILSQRQETISRHFSGRPVEGLEISFVEVDDVPALNDNLATLICTVERICDGGDHRVIFGRVDALARQDGDLIPLIYYAGSYRQLAQQPQRLDTFDLTEDIFASTLNVTGIFETQAYSKRS